MTAKEHNKLVGIFLMAHGAFQGIAMFAICMVYGIIGSAVAVGSQRREGAFVGLAVVIAIIAIAIAALVFILPQILGGYKLWKERPTPEHGALSPVLSLASRSQLGTAAGVYGLWFLFGEEGKNFYLGGSPQYAFDNPPQAPPPSGWQ